MIYEIEKLLLINIFEILYNKNKITYEMYLEACNYIEKKMKLDR